MKLNFFNKLEKEVEKEKLNKLSEKRYQIIPEYKN